MILDHFEVTATIRICSLLLPVAQKVQLELPCSAKLVKIVVRHSINCSQSLFSHFWIRNCVCSAKSGLAARYEFSLDNLYINHWLQTKCFSRNHELQWI